MENQYDPKTIEKKWQKKWEEEKTYSVSSDFNPKEKCYILPQLPYPSGSGLHVGHAEVYAACDIYARFQRMMGKDVLQVFGLDSFGLPAENYAIKTGVHPAKTIDETGANFVDQVKKLGASVDWDRFVRSSDPGYYKFTQWFFLLMYERGLAYRKKQLVNWCDGCKTVLANEQVVNGKCERSDDAVIQKEMEQWYLKITDYADRLIDDLDKVDWPEETKRRQRNWIGRSEGAEITFPIVIADDATSSRHFDRSDSEVEKSHASTTQNSDTSTTRSLDSLAVARDDVSITVFTTRPDTIFGAMYMVLAPEHQLVASLLERTIIENTDEVRAYVEATSKKTELERQVDQEKTGVELQGIKAINPVSGEEISVWIADYVLASYGTGAIMAVPAHDERDFAFEETFALPVKQVVEGDKLPITAYGKAVNSDFLNGLSTEDAKENIIAHLEEKGTGKRKVQYKLRDWSVSRQRFWGAPVPMLYDEKGELHPVPFEDLPVTLPSDVDFKPTGQSPLTYSEEFQAGVEEKYGKGWKREVDTLDTFMCSSWYFFRYLDPHNENEFASPEALKKWMPVDFYLGGEEHVNGHLLYSRFFTKILFDAGYIDFDEPFKVNRHQGLILGSDSRKMSKRWGNVINPTDVIDEYGADTLRIYEMFMGPLEQTKPWNDNGVKGVRRFLERTWRLREKIGGESTEEAKRQLHKTIKKVKEDCANLQFNTAVAAMMELVNAYTKEDTMSKEDFALFVLILSPFAPHMANELWEMLGNSDLDAQAWPAHDESLLVADTIEIVVQVNGKVRAKLTVDPNISKEDIEKLALEQENVQKFLEGKAPKKIIYVPGKLVSVVV